MRLPKIATWLFVVALIAAACGGGTSTADSDAAAPADTAAPAEAVAADEPGDEEMAGEEMAHEEEGDHHAEEAPHEEEGDHHDEAESDHHDEEMGDFDREVEVTLRDFQIEPASLTVARGETIKFHINNNGLLAHEFRLTTQHAAEEHIESGHAGHDEAGEPGLQSDHDHGDIVFVVAPGTSDSLIVTFDADADFDTLGCLIPGHFEAGMRAEFVIET